MKTLHRGRHRFVRALSRLVAVVRPNRKSVAFSAFLFLGDTVAVAFAATGPSVPALESLDRDIPSLLEKWQVPGAAVAVALDGRIEFVRGFAFTLR